MPLWVGTKRSRRSAFARRSSLSGLSPTVNESKSTPPAASSDLPPRAARSAAVSAAPGTVERQLELLAAIARRTGNGVIATNAEGRIEWVNDGFSRLTGFTVDEVMGRRPGEILQGPDTSAECRAQMSAALREGRPFDVVALNYGKGGRQYWVRIEAEPTLDPDGRVTGYVALETDVTEQRIAEGREAITRRIGDLLLSAESVEDAAHMIVDELVRSMDVRTAQAWSVEPGNPNLQYLTGASADRDGAPWLEAGATTTFRKGTEWVVGVGAPGMAWGTGTPCVRTDFWQPDKNGLLSRRAEAAQRARIRTVCAVPVRGPDGIVAIVEIGGSHRYPGYERLPSLLEQVAQQFGAFIVQHQSRKAFEALFRQSPDALLVVDGAGQVVRANARAVALFGEVADRPLAALLEGADELLGRRHGAWGELAPLHQRRAHRLDGTSFSAEVALSNTTATGAALNIVSVRDLTERHRAEEALRRSLEEKVTLVHEVHHRVKNNLQIISSLVSMQAEDVQNETVRKALLDTTNRIQSMALVHQQLYASDNIARIVFGDYARALCNAIRVSMGGDATLTFEAEPVEIAIEKAVPAGLILNELVTNAFKHGRGQDGRCTVHVRVRGGPTSWAFLVADEGSGVVGEPVRKGSMGQTLIRALVRQLRARRTDGSMAASGMPAMPEGARVGMAVRIEVPWEA
jgi:PAS domain S-box-containing protein